MKKENRERIEAIKRAKQQISDSDDLKSVDAQPAQLADVQDMSRRSGKGIEVLDELEGVKDKEAYREWRRLKRLPILNEDMMVVCSDNSKVNLGWFPTYFENRISHLPISEREVLHQKRAVYQTTHMKANQAKVKAYGLSSVKKAQAAAQVKSKEVGFLKAKKAQILELFGKMFSTDEVHKVIVEQWKFPVALSEVIDFKRNNLAVIKEKQEIYKSNYSDLRLSNKRPRLEELTNLYNRLKDKIDVTNNREDIRAAMGIIAEIRKEVEGERLTINGKLDLSIEADINAHLQKEVFKEFSLQQIIIGRVASRWNVDSSRIIQGLANSYYARYNRFLGNEPEDIDWEEIEHPSTMGFDFEKIGRAYKEKETRQAAEKVALKLAEGKTQLRVAQGGLKEALMAKLAEKTGDVKRDKLRLEQTELTKAKLDALKAKGNLRDSKD